jgi:hypothetical protein
MRSSGPSPHSRSWNSFQRLFPDPGFAGRWSVCLAGLAMAAVGCTPPRVDAPSADSVAVDRVRATLVSASDGTAGSTEEAASGTGWATITGRFTYAGDPGQPRQLVVDKDLEVCARGGMKLFDRSLVVDPSSRGVANVVVFARKTTRVKDPVATEPVVFDQKDCEFLTPVLAVRVGRPIDVKNSDPIGHNTNIAGSSFNQLIPANASTVYKPTGETGLPTMVTCNIHPWMKAWAVFRKDGYVAVTGADGSFTIPDLPAGETIEFQVWHERTGSGGVGLPRPDLKWTPRGRFQLKLDEGEVRDLGTLEIPAAALDG